jgi:hypothetical protein
LYIVSYAGRVSRISSTEAPPSSPRKRPADASIVGFAASRSTAATQHTNPPLNSITAPQGTRPGPFSDPARAMPLGGLFMHNGELWIVAVDDTGWMIMTLREFLVLSWRNLQIDQLTD